MIVYKIVTEKESKQKVKRCFQDFFKNIYNQELTDANWEHQFIHSPYEDSALFLAFDDKKIVGSALMIPQKFSTESASGSYYLWTTSAIDKEYRSKGLYAEILKMQREYTTENHKDFIFAFPNKLAYPVVKLFGGFKDLYKTDLVKTSLDAIDFKSVENSLVIDATFANWRFEHKAYLFYIVDAYILVTKQFEETLDVLAIYTRESLGHLHLPTETGKIPSDIVTLKTFLKDNAEAKKLDTLSGTYFPINKNIDYENIKLNLLMSDVF